MMENEQLGFEVPAGLGIEQRRHHDHALTYDGAFDLLQERNHKQLTRCCCTQTEHIECDITCSYTAEVKEQIHDVMMES